MVLQKAFLLYLILYLQNTFAVNLLFLKLITRMKMIYLLMNYVSLRLPIAILWSNYRHKSNLKLVLKIGHDLSPEKDINEKQVGKIKLRHFQHKITITMTTYYGQKIQKSWKNPVRLFLNQSNGCPESNPGPLTSLIHPILITIYYHVRPKLHGPMNQ